MAYLQRLLAPSLPWELKTTKKGLGLYVKSDCALQLSIIAEQLGRAEVVELTEEQWQRACTDPEQRCLVESCGTLGAVIGPVALLNKPRSGCAPHLLLCNLPSVSAVERLKERRRTVLQYIAGLQPSRGEE